MRIEWTIPGTTEPEKCDLFELMEREDRGERVTTSEVVISYHFLDKDTAREISARVLTPTEAKLFYRLRAINPMQFQTPRAWWQFWVKRETVTWLHYAMLLGYTEDSFLTAWNGVGGRIQRYLKTRSEDRTATTTATGECNA